ncbi:mirror-image polydactyly gene 1 protein isoform X3 [Synchiropus splendidus]|uniref:mirror-image polydactyly gene 1 protein isoform X3 n=1 Tax=Synchiropus splendidus TaxID=270530 RepID=UPI00237D5771|nr:mirror-image polydactyly gene 1 protein isoform X3 [Synchiropus splendidus]
MSSRTNLQTRTNPQVNEELRRRLPSPARQTLLDLSRSSPDLRNSSLASQQHLVSPASHRRSASPLPRSQSISPLPPLSQRRSVSPVSPLSLRRSTSPVSPLSLRRSASPVSPPAYRRAVSPVSPLSHKASISPVSPLPRRLLTQLNFASTGKPGDMDSPGTQRHTHSPNAAQAGGQQVLTENSLTQAPDKDLPLLLKELDALRDINKRLHDQLVHKEEELQRREVEEELREAREWEAPGGLLQEVLSSQKKRDQAMMSRLLRANQERDEALLRVQRLQQAAKVAPGSLGDPHMEVEELLQRVCEAETAEDVQQFGAVLLQNLQLARQRRREITAQEMKAVMEERDGSVMKCKRLEQERMQEKESMLSKDELLRLQEERDAALDQRRQLEVELQSLREGQSSATASHPTTVQLQQLSTEKQSLEAEVQRCQEAEQEAAERVRRLERLVEVLRKKVGTGSLRAVI